MVMTILEAHVEQAKWASIEQTFREAVSKLDAGIVRTFLLHNSADSTVWQIVTVWESREALAKMRQQTELPRGVLIFRGVGGDPKLSIYDIAVHVKA